MTPKQRFLLGTAVIGLAIMVMTYMVFPVATWALNPQPLPPGLKHGTGSGGGAGKIIMTPSNPTTTQPGTDTNIRGNSNNQGREF